MKTAKTYLVSLRTNQAVLLGDGPEPIPGNARVIANFCKHHVDEDVVACQIFGEVPPWKIWKCLEEEGRGGETDTSRKREAGARFEPFSDYPLNR